MRRMCWILGMIAALLVAGTMAFAAEPIKVGIVDSYSGPPSTYTNDVRDGFKMAVDAINAKGGVLGRKITFVTRDDKFKVDLALSAAKELIMREKVDLLMGTINERGGPGCFRPLQEGKDPLPRYLLQERQDNRSEGASLRFLHGRKYCHDR